MVSNQKVMKNFFSLNVKDDEEMKELLIDIGFKIDEEGFVFENHLPVLDSENEPVHYSQVNSILPGPKIIVKDKDYSRVSQYYLNKMSL